MFNNDAKHAVHVMFIVHIGETLGHLVRALSIADALSRYNINISIACSNFGHSILSKYRKLYKHYPITWEFSHNACHSPYFPHLTIKQIETSTKEMIEIISYAKPNLIIGCPGILSSQVSRSLNIPHVSILHGPYLTPLYKKCDWTDDELSVIEFTNDLFMDGPLDYVYNYLNTTLNLMPIDYAMYLQTENIVVAQQGIPLEVQHNINVVEYIRASFGPDIDMNANILSQTCYITFGSGNPCKLDRIVRICTNYFEHVLVSCGERVREYNNATVMKYVGSSSLAGRVKAVICHGGIGTVGTFAEFGTPQLVIPTEVDQANMVVIGVRQGIIKECGFTYWASSPRLGRHLPAISDEELVESIRTLSRQQKHPAIRAHGAEQAANYIYSIL